MSTPVALAVLQSIQTALRAIAVSSGYFYDVKSTSVVLDPIPLAMIPTTETPFFVLDPEANGQNLYTTSRPVALKVDFTVPICVRVDAPGDDPDRKRTAGWQVYADVERALSADPQRGLLALYTYVEWPTFGFGPPSQNEVYVEIPVRVLLQRAYGTP